MTDNQDDITAAIGTGAIMDVETHIDDAKFFASLAKARGIHLAARINPQLTLAYSAQEVGAFMAKEAIRGIPLDVLNEVVSRNVQIAFDNEMSAYAAKMALLETADESNPK